MQARIYALGFVLILAAPLLAASPTPTGGEAELQTILQGYTAEPPQRCVQTTRIRKLKTVDGTAIVVWMGGRLYINRPTNAGALRKNLIPMFEPDADRICEGSAVSLNSSHDLFSMGAVRLKEWIPYRRDGKD